MRRSGSTPLPRLFDMGLPSAAITVGWMMTCSNGMRSVQYMDAITMRATHKPMMSRAVDSTWVGYACFICGASMPSSVQPIVANGHSCDDNHVSSTSSSWRTGFPHTGHVSTSSTDASSQPHSSQ